MTVRARPVPLCRVARVVLTTLVVSALLLTAGTTLAAGRPKPVPVPAFWGPIYAEWSTALGDIPLGPAAFDGGNAYVALRSGRLVAVALATGAIVWSSNQGMTVAPAARDGLVLAVQDVTVRALESATGKLRWRQAVDAPSALAPTIGPGWVAIVTTAPEVVLLHSGDGHLLWKKPLPAPLRAMPTGDAERLYLGLSNGQTVALATSNGAQLWTRTLGGDPLALTIDGDRVLVGTSGDLLYSLSAASGTKRWRWRTGGDAGGGVASDGRRVYFSALDNSLVALGRGGGDRKWEQRLPSRPVGGPVLLGDTLLLVTVASDLKTFASVKGTPGETVTFVGRPLQPPHVVPWAGPVPPRAVVVTAGGHLLAFGPRVEPPVEPLDPTAGFSKLPEETLAPIEPPLVPMPYPPGRLLLPETLPPVIKKPLAERP